VVALALALAPAARIVRPADPGTPLARSPVAGLRLSICV